MRRVLPGPILRRFPEALEIEPGLGQEQLENLALEGPVAERISGEMHQIHGTLGHGPRPVTVMRMAPPPLPP